MTIEIGMPLYRPSGRLESVLIALANQTYKDFYITMYNDTNPEEIDEIVRDEEIVQMARETYGLRIQLIQNPSNLGYMANMHQIFEKATGDILFLLADDDIISMDCMELCAKAFADDDVGVVARPYYWFTDNMREAVRFEGRIYDSIQYADINAVNPDYDLIWDAMRSAGQLSGLAFRRRYLSEESLFVEDMFTAHIYPFLNIFAKHKCAYMPHPTIAVSITTSQCHTDIYDSSPTQQWLDLYDRILSDSRHEKVCLEMRRRVLRDYLGLAQIKNYGTKEELEREIRVFLDEDEYNRHSVKFFIYSNGSRMIPRALLIWLIDFYKNHILKSKLKSLDINYDIFPIDLVEGTWNAPVAGERER